MMRYLKLLFIFGVFGYPGQMGQTIERDFDLLGTHQHSPDQTLSFLQDLIPAETLDVFFAAISAETLASIHAAIPTVTLVGTVAAIDDAIPRETVEAVRDVIDEIDETLALTTGEGMVIQPDIKDWCKHEGCKCNCDCASQFGYPGQMGHPIERDLDPLGTHQHSPDQTLAAIKAAFPPAIFHAICTKIPEETLFDTLDLIHAAIPPETFAAIYAALPPDGTSAPTTGYYSTSGYSGGYSRPKCINKDCECECNCARVSPHHQSYRGAFNT